MNIEDYKPEEHGGETHYPARFSNPWWNHPEIAEPALYCLIGLGIAGLIGLMIYGFWGLI